jgi:hypothetical protein
VKISMTIHGQHLSLFPGLYSILGRGLAIHAHDDDLGRVEGDQESVLSGNAGEAIALGVIAVTTGPFSGEEQEVERREGRPVSHQEREEEDIRMRKPVEEHMRAKEQHMEEKPKKKEQQQSEFIPVPSAEERGETPELNMPHGEEEEVEAEDQSSAVRAVKQEDLPSVKPMEKGIHRQKGIHHEEQAEEGMPHEKGLQHGEMGTHEKGTQHEKGMQHGEMGTHEKGTYHEKK